MQVNVPPTETKIEARCDAHARSVTQQDEIGGVELPSILREGRISTVEGLASGYCMACPSSNTGPTPGNCKY